MDDYQEKIDSLTIETLLLYGKDYRILTIRKRLAEERLIEVTPGEIVVRAFVDAVEDFDVFDDYLVLIDTQKEYFESFCKHFENDQTRQNGV